MAAVGTDVEGRTVRGNGRGGVNLAAGQGLPEAQITSPSEDVRRPKTDPLAVPKNTDSTASMGAVSIAPRDGRCQSGAPLRVSRDHSARAITRPHDDRLAGHRDHR